LILVGSILLYTTTALKAGGWIRLYSIVDKVVFKPDATSPERIQVWGTFVFKKTMADTVVSTGKPVRGYVYFNIPPDTNVGIPILENNWQELQDVAGTSQAVEFGVFDANAIRLRQASQKPADPDKCLGLGVTMLRQDDVMVAQIRELLQPH
jgi:hypothetical protein